MEQYLIYIVLAVVGLSVFLLIKFGSKTQKDLITRFALVAVREVGKNFFELNGKDKFLKAVAITHGMLPVWLQLFVSRKNIEYIVQLAYEEMKNRIDRELAEGQTKIIDAGLSVATSMTKKLVELDVGGNKDIVTNSQIKEVNKEIEDKIYGEAKLKTNFKDETELLATMGFSKRI